MKGLWIALVWLMWVSVFSALAEVYRWTDDAGKVHLTDNPETIPPAYRARARASGSGTPAAAETPSVDVQPAPPRPRSQERLPALQAPASSAPLTTPEIAELERRIAAARQERQTYFEQLSSEREVHANPLFVRQRRQIAELGYALLNVEQQLDALQAALEQAQQQLQARHTPPLDQSNVVLDQAGNDATYWHQRVTAARERLQQAQMQRRDLLTQLTAVAGAEQGIVGRQGYEMLQQAQALQQVEQEIDAAEAALQAVQQEALQAGAPRAWLQ
jgi:DNA repair exonuclease SbcCD ATPase subunit